MTSFASRRSRALVGLVGVFALLAAGIAEARPGRGGGSFGSRGSRTYDAPPATSTAPSAQPMQRTQTPQPAPNVQRPGTVPQTQAAQPRRFGFGTGLFAGLLGAGLLGMLFGNGFLGGLAGLASFFGLLLQIALIGGLVWLAVRFFRRRQEPAVAGAGGRDPLARSALGGLTPPVGGGAPGLGAGSGLGAGRLGSLAGLGGASPRPRERSDEVGIGEGDYAAFERALHEITDAYSREDVAGLWNLATPEMAGYLQEELNENARNGVINKSSGVRLLQGDLAEAWREGETDYATVAMRFAMNEVTVDKATGRIVSGDPNTPTEAAELWTFRRDRGGPWKLSAIQQTA
jgi:predicted lipid-binding transport protein (Tim44 family)